MTFPSKTPSLPGLERNLSLKLFEITDVFIIADSKRLPFNTMNPAFCFIGFLNGVITFSSLIVMPFRFSDIFLPVTVITFP